MDSHLPRLIDTLIGESDRALFRQATQSVELCATSRLVVRQKNLVDYDEISRLIVD